MGTRSLNDPQTHREMRNVNEVTTFARAGEAAGAAVGTRVKSTRKGTRKKAREGAARARKEVKRARKGAVRARHLRGDITDRWGTAQEVLAERAFDARRELATRIDPKPARRRRWPLLLLILAIGGVVATAVLARRPQPEEPTGFGANGSATRPGPAGHVTSGPHGNGLVAAERPSATTD